MAATGERTGDLNGDATGLLGGLTPVQRRAVTSDAAPLCIVASAGAGKTRVLTRRIAYRCQTGAAAAPHTLALTFTRKAAGELRHRLAGLGLRDGVAAGTFHALAAAQLQRWWADRHQAPPALLDRKSRLLGPILDERAALVTTPLAEVATLIEWAKARALAPEDLAGGLARHGRPLPKGLSGAALAAVYERYEAEKRRRGLIDFDDLLVRCADAIERDPEFAGAQRWRWRHVYVDEFQDLNPLQHRLLLAWLGTSTDLCVVGDPNQAIYAWNGADPSLLRDMPARWPDTEVIHLDANHRCTEEIVSAAAAVLGGDGARLTAAGRRGPAPAVHSYRTDAEEAAAIAAQIIAAQREGRSWSAMAVLTRTNAQLAVIQSALAGAGVPCWSAAAAAGLSDPSVRAVLDDLRSRGHLPLQGVLADLEDPLLDLGRTFHVLRPDATVAQWLAWLPVLGPDRSGEPGRPAAVTLCSFHRAKGLEWDLVWVAGVEEGLVPMGRAAWSSGPAGAAENEERRLLYVALTRAMDEVQVSWVRTRSFGGRPVPRQPSRWIAVLESAASDGVAGVAGTGPGPGSGWDSGDWRRSWRQQQSRLREVVGAGGRPLGRRVPADWPEADDGVRAALRAWRVDMARSTGVAPHAVLHDLTLEALASLRPATMAELLAVPGFGPVKANRYGPSLLDILGRPARSA